MERRTQIEEYENELKLTTSPKLKEALSNAIKALHMTTIPVWYIKNYVDAMRFKSLRVVVANPKQH